MQTTNQNQVQTTRPRRAAWAWLLAVLLAASGLARVQGADAAAAPAGIGGDSLPCVVDLTPFYTMKYKSTDRQGFVGRQTLDGLPFDLGGEFTLWGRENDRRNNVGKTEITGIPVNRKFDELHLLHSMQWREYLGCPVAIIRLHYADGSTNDFSLRAGYQVNDWNRLLTEENEAIADPDTKIVWRGPGIYKGTARLFMSVLKNPFPKKEVVSMDVISTRTRASYTLVAATVAKSDPQREVTPGLPLGPNFNYDGTLKVTVVDKETGAPLAGVDVYPSASIDDEGVVADPILTSTNGTVLVKYPVGRTSYLGVEVSKDGYLGQRGYWRDDNSVPAEITYRLAAARARIGGVVQDGDGKALAGAQIRLNSYSFGNDGEQVYLPNNTTQTDATGHWRFEGLPENYQDFGITVSHDDFPQTQFFADGAAKRGMQGNHIATADFYADMAVLKLTSGNKLSGSVRDTDGKPVVGAAIFVGFDRYMSGAIKSKTDARGNFNLKNLGGGENYLTISAKGFAPQFLTPSIAASNAPVAVTLKPGQTVRGRVVDAAGKPIEGAGVSFDGLAERNGMFSGRTIEWNTKTDAGGEFTWDSAPAEPVRLSIRKDGYMSLSWITVQTGSADVKIFTLGSPLTVKGSVTDADSGEPVVKFSVTPGWPEGNGGARLEKRRATPGKDGHYEVRFDSPIIISPTPYDFVFQISAPGYAPAQSGNIKPDAGVVTWDVKLKKTPATIASVKTPDGKPAAGVKVFLAGERDYLQLDGKEISNQNRESDNFETDAEGHFALPPQAGPFNLVAASPAGFAFASQAEFTNSLTLTLQPWGRVEGTLTRNGRPLPGRELYFFLGDGSEQRNVWMKTPVTVDAQGRFTFPFVPTGTVRIELKQPMREHSWTYTELQTVEVKPNATNVVQVSLDGRDVVGHWKKDANLPAEVNLDQANIWLRPNVEPPPVPEGMDDQEKIREWYQAWAKTDAGKKYMAAQRKGGQLQMKADGTLRGESVAPGKYTLAGNFWGNAGTVAEIANREVIVPESTASDTDAPFDLGEVLIKAVKHLNIGEAAPEFTVQTLDGQPLKLSDFRGKYVLVDFWATWCGPCVGETPHMKAAYDAYGSDPRFVMVSLSLDQKTAQPKKFAKEHDIKWPQGFLGDWSKDTVTKDYSVRGIPSIFLIGPDGKIIAMNLRGESIKSAIGSALAAK